MSIPQRLIRTAPDDTTPEMDRFWEIARGLHPGWEYVDLRNSASPTDYPVTSPYWKDAETGAQWADLVRTEELWHRGGVYIDSDVECWRPFDILCPLEGFVAYEDPQSVPNSVMGFAPHHPALEEVLTLSIARRHWGTHTAGAGTTTEVFMGRDDLLLLPPGSFYPLRWSEVQGARDQGVLDFSEVRAANPWAFCLHHAYASWKP